MVRKAVQRTIYNQTFAGGRVRQKPTEGPSETASRRKFLSLGAAVGGALTACAEPQEVVEEAPKRLGRAPDKYGERSPFERSSRLGRRLEKSRDGVDSFAASGFSRDHHAVIVALRTPPCRRARDPTPLNTG